MPSEITGLLIVENTKANFGNSRKLEAQFALDEGHDKPFWMKVYGGPEGPGRKTVSEHRFLFEGVKIANRVILGSKTKLEASEPPSIANSEEKQIAGILRKMRSNNYEVSLVVYPSSSLEGQLKKFSLGPDLLRVFEITN